MIDKYQELVQRVESWDRLNTKCPYTETNAYLYREALRLILSILVEILAMLIQKELNAKKIV